MRKCAQVGKKQIAIWVDPTQEAATAAFLAGRGSFTRNAAALPAVHFLGPDHFAPNSAKS